RSSNVFLPNGSRLYLDVGSHPEYATAECDRLTDLIAQDSAGDAILADLLADAQAALEADGHDGRAHLVKNNTDAQGNSYGSHENQNGREKVRTPVTFRTHMPAFDIIVNTTLTYYN